MRYFRFGDKSMTAAILFGLFEELRLPHFRTLRENLHKEIEDNSAIRNKRLLSFLLEPRVRSECMFSAWNYDELVLDAVIEAVEQFTGSRGRQRGNVIEELRGKFAFQLVNACEKSSNHILIPTLYLDKADQCALLLYPGRTMDSYVVTKCRHIYIKSDLTARPTLSTDTLMSQEDSEICAVKGCQQVIELVFPEAMSRSVLPSRVHFDLVDSREKDTLRKYFRETATEPIKCQYCGVRNAPCQCSAGCRICIECALVAYCSYGYSFRCPICEERLSKDLCMLLVDELPRRISWAPIPQPKVNCDYCRQPVDIEGVREIPQAGKLTFACSVCSAKRKLATDPSLAASIWDLPAAPGQSSFDDSMISHSSTDSIILRSKSLPLLPLTRRYAGYISASFGDYMENCLLCGRLSSCYTVLKALRHDCWVCDDCIHALYDSKWIPACPICNTIVGGTALKSIRQWGEAVNSLPWMNTPVICSLCMQEKPKKETTKGDRLAHNCIICNFCLLAFHSPSVCPKCLETYDQQDKAILALFIPSAPSRTVSQTSSQAGRQQPCSECGGVLGRTHPRCRNACMCSLCLLQNYVFTNSNKCPKCTMAIRGRLPDAVYCSGCSRQLVIEAESQDAVSGVCDNACVLCCFCIKISRKEPICQVCEALVETIEIQYITKWQKTFKLGCYCGKDKGAKIQMPCGCKAHSECYPKLRACRTCGHEYKKKQSQRKLTSYFT